MLFFWIILKLSLTFFDLICCLYFSSLGGTCFIRMSHYSSPTAVEFSLVCCQDKRGGDMSLDQRRYTVWFVCALLYCRTLQFPSVSRKKVTVVSQPFSWPLKKSTTINKIQPTSKNTIILSNCGLGRDSCKPDFHIIVCSSHKQHVQWPVFKITTVIYNA